MSKPNQDKQISVPSELIPELLTESEKKMVKQRFAIMERLREGLPVRRIAEEVGVGTDTVVRTARLMRENEQLKKYFQKEKTSDSSKWIFGQIGFEEEKH